MNNNTKNNIEILSNKIKHINLSLQVIDMFKDTLFDNINETNKKEIMSLLDIIKSNTLEAKEIINKLKCSL